MSDTNKVDQDEQDIAEQGSVQDAVSSPEDAVEEQDILEGDIVDNDEIVNEETDPLNNDAESDVANGAELEKVTLLLEDARNKADEHWDQCLRLKADIENLKRRHDRELEKAHKFALDNFAQELLPVVDSLELGLNAASESNADVEKVLTEGSVLTLKLLKSALEKFGIKEVNPIGEAFNPEWHQAMAAQESDKVSPNTILTVYQKGYLLNERVVRPAMVVVAKACESSQDNKQDKTARNETKDSDADGAVGSHIDEQA